MTEPHLERLAYDQKMREERAAGRLPGEAFVVRGGLMESSHLLKLLPLAY